MDLQQAVPRGFVHPTLLRHNPRALKNRKTKISNPQSRATTFCKLKDKDTDVVDTYGVCHQLSPVAETVSASHLLSKLNLYQTIDSDGADEKLHLEEGGWRF